MTRILGIDPGSRITGFGIIDLEKRQTLYVASGCIKLNKTQWLDKLKDIFEAIQQIVTEYKPEIVAIERVFVNKNIASALKLGQARGAALTAIACANLPVSEYAPREIKKAVVGYGNADKQQIQKMVTTILKLSATPSTDAADALAIALCHSNSLNSLFSPL